MRISKTKSYLVSEVIATVKKQSSTLPQKRNSVIIVLFIHVGFLLLNNLNMKTFMNYL